MERSVSWKIQQIEQWIEQSQDYRERAFLIATKELMQEQLKRIKQHQQEIDGRLWSPKEW